jgi:hypothetical protein
VAREGLSIPFGDAGLELPSPILSDVVVQVDGPRARALFRVETEGNAGPVHVGYVGGESLSLALGVDGWQPEHGVFLPRLASVLASLPAPEVQPLRAYFVRIEGDRATVSEVDGPSEKPVTRRIELQRAGDSWRSASGMR